MKIFPTIFLVALVSRQVFATTSSETLQQKFRNERRFTLYNSRKLEGKCIEVCEPPEETEAPTAALSTVSSMASSSASSTLSPTLSPTVTPKILDPTNRPSMKPTNEPTNKPTNKPTNEPTNKPTTEPTNKPTNKPTSDPTNKPTNKPTSEPTNKPTNKPTTEPTNKPTNKPTTEPTNKPTNKPTTEPTNKPTNKPTSEPTNKPTNKPTKSPTKEPTKSPTKAPTNQPTDAGPTYECVWPQAQYSAITKGDMINGAKNVYKKLAVGGSFINPSNSHVTVNGRVYYGNRIQGRVNYNGGTQKINDLADIPVDYEHYEWLARNLKSSNIGGKRVIVKTTGKDGKRNGCYSTYDFTPGGQGEDNGNTLVVFNTSDDICLTKTSDGRQFGPTVLAPFSKVTLTNSGYLDGTVIAKSFTTVVGNNKGTEQQLHGDNYKGQIECIEPETAKPTNAPTASPTELPERSVPVPDGCACEAGDQSLARSWKCGNDVYVCPGMTHICKNSPSQNSLFYSITEEQCDAMKLVQLGDKCVALPQYELDQPKGLSHRVCYDGEGLPVKEDGQCEECQGLVDIAFEPTAAPVNDTEQDDGACGCETGSDADSSWRCGKHVYVCPNVEKVCSSQGRTVSEYFKLTQAQCDEMKTKSLGDKCVQIAADGMNKRNMISRVCYNNKTTGVHGMLQAKDQECKFCKDSFSPTLKSSNRLLSALESAMNAFSSTSN